MKKILFTITGNTCIARDCYRMELCSETDCGAADGEFVDVAIEGLYLRRPISVYDCTERSLTLIYKNVGAGSARMAAMVPGEKLEILTGLGKCFDPEASAGAALLVGGGLGAAPLYRICRELLERRRKVSVILGFNKADEVCLDEDFRKLGVEPQIVTVDGSVGLKGFPTDAIRQIAPEFEYFYCCGPMVMMKAVCTMLDCPGEASLEERMGCAAGFCYGCSIMTSNGPRRVCKDGPVFKKEEIIWQ